MKHLLTNRKIDLVDFDHYKAFMFKDDNLYKKFVDMNRKEQDLLSFHSEKEARTKKKFDLNQDFISNPKNLLYIFLNHLITNKVDFHVLDIGAHVGSFSLKCASYFKSISYDGKITSFDPTHAGSLVEYNSRLNGLEKYIKHEMLAISENEGILNFSYKLAHSDSSKITSNNSEGLSFFKIASTFFKAPIKSKIEFIRKILVRLRNITTKSGESYSLLVESVNIVEYLKANKIDSNLFIKIDIEGFDKQIITQIMPVLGDRIMGMITEFSSFNDPEAVKYLEFLATKFYIYDIGYTPTPFICKEIKAEDFSNFANDVVYRKYGYTDILLINKTIPDYLNLEKSLKGIVSKAEKYII